MNINEMINKAHQNAKEKGWWVIKDGQDPNIPEKLALIHSEVSEALEAYRDGLMGTTVLSDSPKPEGFPVELADVVIRIADLCGFLGIDLQEAIERKMAYNRLRPYRHGGKLA